MHKPSAHTSEQKSIFIPLLRAAYIGYVLTVFYITTLRFLDFSLVLGTRYTDDFIFAAVSITFTILMMILFIHAGDLPNSIWGMLRLFIPLPLLLMTGVFNPDSIAVLEISIIHMTAVAIAYPIWLFLVFVARSKESYTARFVAFMAQMIFYSVVALIAYLFVFEYVQFWKGNAEQNLAMWVSVISVVLLAADHTIAYVRAALKHN